jgi:transcriptional regulator with XRE-family HTH domain
MSFNDISSRLKKINVEQQQADGKPLDIQELYAIRSRMLGVLITDARHAAGYDLETLAEGVGVDTDTVQAWEYGQSVPSLPQIELMAYILQVPISHFWGTETFEKRRDERQIDGQEYSLVRDRMIGLMIATARQEKNLSDTEVADKLGIHPDDLSAYELGQLAVPMTVLTSLSSLLEVSLNYFLEDNGRVAHFLEVQSMSDTFARMPEDIRDFISAPAHEAYIRVAMALAHIPTENLRALAEGLIDITM